MVSSERKKKRSGLFFCCSQDLHNMCEQLEMVEVFDEMTKQLNLGQTGQASFQVRTNCILYVKFCLAFPTRRLCTCTYFNYSLLENFSITW